ncbi:MAG: immunoglobulin-like domain-containing protein [Patescibacteria group bacterium]
MDFFYTEKRRFLRTILPLLIFSILFFPSPSNASGPSVNTPSANAVLADTTPSVLSTVAQQVYTGVNSFFCSLGSLFGACGTTKTTTVVTPSLPTAPVGTPNSSASIGATPTIVNNYITQPVIHETTVSNTGGVTQGQLAAALNQLENKLSSKFFSIVGTPNSSSSIGAAPVNITQIIQNPPLPFATRIDKLENVILTTPTVSGGSFSNPTISGGSIVGTSISATTGSFSGDVTILGNLIAPSSVTTYGASIAPYFTATSSTATSTFAGGMNVAGDTGLTVLQNGKVGIGTAAPRFGLSLGSITNAGTDTPDTIDLGGTYSSTPGSNLKLRAYWDGAVQYGIGVSANQMEFVTTVGSQVWFNAGSEKMRLTQTGNLGIGTTTPAARLSLNQPSTTALGLYLAGFSNATVDLFRISTSTLTATSTAFVVNSNGKVGIGTTSPQATLGMTGSIGVNSSHLFLATNGNVGIGTTSPTQRLSLQGSALFSGDLNLANLTATGTISTPNLTVTGFVNGGAQCLQINASGVVSGTGGVCGGAGQSPAGVTGTMQYNNGGVFGGTANIFFDSTNSRLGIGTSTPGTLTELYASNTGTTLATLTEPSLSITNSATTVNNFESLLFRHITSTGAQQTMAQISGVNLVHTNAIDSGALAFLTRNAGTLSEKMRLTNAGLFGVGTSTPSSLVEVYGSNTGTLLTTFADPTLSITNPNTTVNNFSTLAFRHITSTGAETTMSQISGVNLVHTNAADSGALAFLTRNTGTLAEKMRITNQGLVGIGTTSPGLILTVSATSSLSNLGLFDVVAVPSAGATTTALRVISSGNVGIGTSSPYSKLSVAGEVVAQNFTATSTATSTFAGGVGIGTTSPQANLGIQGSIGVNASQLYLAATGNVGINTTNPGALFSVNGTASTSLLTISGITTATGQCLQINSLGVVSGTGAVCGGAGSVPAGSSGALQFNNAGVFGGGNLSWDNTNNILSTTAGTFSLNSFTGNVGIGTSTPYAALSIAGASGVVANIFTATSTTATSTFAGGVGIGTTSPSATLSISGDTYTSGNLSATNITASGTASSSALTVSGLATLQSLTISGIASTAQCLQINSLGVVSGTGTTCAGGSGSGSTTPQGVSGALQFNNGGVLGGANPLIWDNINNIFSLSDPTKLGIGTTSPQATIGMAGSIGVNSSQLVLASSGFVGIGTTTPSDFLHVFADNAHTRAIIQATGSFLAGVSLTTDTSQWTIDNRGTFDAPNDRFLITHQGVAVRMVIDNTGNVGFGTSSPYAKISIGSTATASTTLALRPIASQTGNILDIYNTSGALTSVMTASGKLGIGTSSPFATFAVNPIGGQASNQFVVGSSTATNFIITNGGLVGIGTTSPSQVLSVNGGGLFNGALSGVTSLAMNGNLSGVANLTTTGTVTFANINGSAQCLHVDSSGNLTGTGSDCGGAGSSPGSPVGGIQFNTGGVFTASTSLTFDNTTTGLLGIGTTTPTSSIEIYKTSSGTTLATFAEPTLSITNPNTTVNNFSTLAFRHITSTGAETTNSQISGVNLVHTNAADSGALAFLTRNAGTLAEKMRLTNAGLLGVGTSTPGSLIEVYASAAGTTLTTHADPTLSITNSNTTVNNFSTLAFRHITSTGAETTNSQISGINLIHTNAADSGIMAFLTRNAGTLAEKMRITNTGLVGIGTTTPFAQLSVNPNAIGSAAAFIIGSSTATNFVVTNGGNVGIGTAVPGSLLTVAGLTSTTNLTVSGITNGSGQCLQINSAGAVSGTGAVCGGSGSVPLGSTGALQYNNGGLFAGAATMIWDATNNRLGIGTSTPYTALGVAGTVVADNYIATSTTAPSVFTYASTTALTVTGVNSLFVSGVINSATSTAAGITTTDANTTSTFAGSLSVNGTASTSLLTISNISNGAGQCLQINATGQVTGTGAACGGSGSVPGGSTGAIQYNTGGVFTGGNLTWDNTLNALNTNTAILSLGGNALAGSFTATSTTATSTFTGATFSGNVGIGTTTPSAKLTIDNRGNDTNPFSITTNGSVGNYTATNTAMFIRDAAGTELMRIFASDSNGAHFNSGNLYMGYQAGASNPVANVSTSGYYNTGVGYQTMLSNTSGVSNTANGWGSLLNNTSGSYNAGFGMYSLAINFTGSNNASLGAYSQVYNGSATSSTAVGYAAGSGLGGGSQFNNQGGTYVGYQSGYNLRTNSDYNTFLGYQSGYGVTTGKDNIILGTATSSTAIANLTTGSQNILIGSNISFPSATASGQLTIGNIIYGTGNTGAGSNLSTGKIGIGTANPTQKLDIAGSLAIQGGTINFGTGSATSTLTSVSGNLGIGTTTPGATFAVTGSGLFSTQVSTPNLSITGITNGGAQCLQINAQGLVSGTGGVCGGGGSGSVPAGSDGALQFNSGGVFGGGHLFWNDTTNNLTTDSGDFLLNPTGNIGIGTTTTNSTFKVTLQGSQNIVDGTLYLHSGAIPGDSATVSGSVTSAVRGLQLTGGGAFGSSTITAWHNSGGALEINGKSTGVGATTAQITLMPSTSSFTPYLSFSTGGTAFSLTERMKITSTGRIGIGTSTPGSFFSILDIANFATSTGVTFYRGLTTPNFIATSSLASVFPFASTTAITSSGSAYFATLGGAVGIGTTSPSSLLSLTQPTNTEAGGLWIAGTDGDYRSIYISDTTGVLSFGGGDAAGVYNTATLNDAGAWTNASDRKYKENIADLNTKYTLDTLMSIQPRFYTMKGTGKPQIGFIAQELKLVLPEVVEGVDGSMGISYGNMVALLVEAVQELAKKVTGFASEFTTKKLCVDDVCVTRDQFKKMIENSGATSTGSSGSGSESAAPAAGAASSTPSTDITPPVITLTGDNPATISLGSSYIDLGATVTDNVSQNITADLFENTVDTTTAGTYYVIYTAHDAAMNIATSTRSVVVSNPVVTPTATSTDPVATTTPTE